MADLQPVTMRAAPFLATTPALQPVQFRGGGFAPKRLRFVPLVTFLLVLALWWMVTHYGWVSDLSLPKPGEVFTSLVAMVQDGTLAVNFMASIRRLSLGWALGASFGVVIGLAIGLFSLARSSALPLVSALFPIPKIALLPLFVLWLGIGEVSKVATIAFGVFSPMVIATFGGVDNVDRGLIRMAQSFGVPRWTILMRIILPGALPALLSGARISTSIAIILLTAAEMIGAQHGLGAMVLAAGNLMQTDQLLAGVVVLSALGFTLSQIIGWAERRFLHWR